MICPRFTLKRSLTALLARYTQPLGPSMADSLSRAPDRSHQPNHRPFISSHSLQLKATNQGRVDQVKPFPPKNSANKSLSRESPAWPRKPPFLCIPREIRDNIYHLVLQDPAAPIFEGKNKTTKYKNYLGLMYANKLIHGEIKATLEEIKPLFILSCNFEHLGEVMHKHAIPYISDHHAGQVKCHSIRLHVKFPMGNKSAKVLKGFVLLSIHLKDTCLLLRGLSLTIPHAPGQPAVTDGTEFPSMQISVRLESSGGVPMPIANQIQLLEQMTWLNNIGKITVSGCNDEEGNEWCFSND
jgi:hypothetical protein